MTASPELDEPADVLYRIKRGLTGYVSYLAACEMNGSFSEYVLYEPILRILTARRYLVECEVACPGLSRRNGGDRKRLDFVARRGNLRFALEVKWARARSLDVSNDQLKMAAFMKRGSPKDRAFLCVFGRESHIGRLALKPQLFEERGDAVVARLGRTRYGCRVFELRPKMSVRGALQS
jgi:hypothetical protein